MKRLLIIALIATVAFLIVRTRLPKLHERMMARCKAMFEQNSSAQPGCCAEPSSDVTAPQTERNCEQISDRAESGAVA